MTTKEKIDKVLLEVNKTLLPKPAVNLTPVRGKTTVFDTKLGGVPYMPKGFSYPTVKEGEFEGKPLMFLAQLNFEKLPHLPDFPEKGILQFYCGCDGDDIIGLDYDHPTSQNRFRVIYHENVITDEAKLITAEDMPEFNSEEHYFPFEGEFQLEAGDIEDISASADDFRFNKAFVDAYNGIYGTDYEDMYDADEEDPDDEDDDCISEYVFENCRSAGTFVGGYPLFTQQDPRDYEQYSEYDTVLFQLDSEGFEEDGIMWGDCGIGNFFISTEDLKKLDFSKALYNWDCG